MSLELYPYYFISREKILHGISACEWKGGLTKGKDNGPKDRDKTNNHFCARDLSI